MLRGVFAITLLNLASIPRRVGSSLVIVIGIAGVVGVLISTLAMAQGFLDTMNHTGRADRAIVLRGGSNSELASTLSRDSVVAIENATGVKTDASGQAVASAEVVAIMERPLKASGTDANVTLRGVGAQAFALRPEIKLIDGRFFQPGLHEVVVGASAKGQFTGLELGAKIPFRDSEWTVVGIFESGDGHDSEVLADVDSVLAITRRTMFQSITLQLQSADGFDAFKEAVEHDPRLMVEALREPAYYARMSERLGELLKIVAYGVGSFMALGALFGALNTMYTAVSARTLEIATLRAIGFRGGPILISVFVEALALSLVGAIIGVSLAWLFFNGDAVNSLSGNFTQVVFKLNVSPRLAATGIVLAGIIGLLGGALPAIRAVRKPVVEALRGG